MRHLFEDARRGLADQGVIDLFRLLRLACVNHTACRKLRLKRHLPRLRSRYRRPECRRPLHPDTTYSRNLFVLSNQAREASMAPPSPAMTPSASFAWWE